MRGANSVRDWSEICSGSSVRLWLFTGLAVSALCVVRPAVAQEFAPQLGRTASDHRVFLSTGWDPTFVLDGGVERVLWRPTVASSVALAGALRLPWVLLPEFDSVGAAVGPIFATVTASGVGLRTAVYGSMRTASDATGRKVGLRLTPELTVGYFARNWSAAAVGNMTTTFATHMRHSEAVRDLFRDRYPEGQAPGDGADGPHDGWYALTAQQFRAGATGGVRLSDSVGLYALAGYVFTPQVGVIDVNPPVGPLPFHAQLGGVVRW
jgi:hypothetical protein